MLQIMHVCHVWPIHNVNYSYSFHFSLASTIGSVVAAPVPGSAPIVSKTIVLQAIGIRSADISLILAVDWLV
jgi:Na+/H+-dicarboxylate symporter